MCLPSEIKILNYIYCNQKTMQDFTINIYLTNMSDPVVFQDIHELKSSLWSYRRAIAINQDLANGAWRYRMIETDPVKMEEQEQFIHECDENVRELSEDLRILNSKYLDLVK